MAKKRKTRKDKILADIHRKSSYRVDLSSFSIPLKKSVQKNHTSSNTAVKTNVHKYPYLIQDVTRTAILTGSIIVFQIILFIILKLQLLKLPGINY